MTIANIGVHTTDTTRIGTSHPIQVSIAASHRQQRAHSASPLAKRNLVK
jgi:hypothetical protein